MKDEELPRTPHPDKRQRHAAAARLPEIDRAKGLAILGVLLIHARPTADTWLHTYVVSQAVPVFLVLFGTTSELWWRRAHTGAADRIRQWYRTRAVRLLIPAWSALVALWSFRFLVGVNTQSPLHVLLTFGGYMPWVGTGWFVTLALELVVLFPFIRWGVAHVGAGVALVAAIAMLVWSELHLDAVVALMRLLLHDAGSQLNDASYYYFWIFPPARIFPVVAGIVLARRGMPSSRTGLAAAALVVAGGLVVDRLGPDPVIHRLASWALCVPLTLAILVAVRPAGIAAGAALAWLGRHSWGVYLGQLVVHEAVHGFASPDEASLGIRWAYFAVLLASGSLAVVVGERLRHVVAARLVRAA
jgi:peptidoglycan/LPS O-acetylase OafA/YrhL